MESIDITYKNLTGVDIAEQKRLWDERGKGYYGEYLVFSELYPHVPGVCKILMNIEIPNGQGATTEIALLLIHETGFYVFEIKHYKGTIYGNAIDKNWTQYFRTTSNKYFYNPIAQNRNHINALAKMFPGIPVHSYIVFTNPDCVLKVTNVPEDVSVCNLQGVLNNIIARLMAPAVLTIKDIDDLFGVLKRFSPMLETPVPIDGEVIPLSDYAQTLQQHCQQFVADKEMEFQQFVAGKEREFQQKAHKVKIKTILIAVSVIAACLFLSVTSIIDSQKKSAEAIAEMEKFAQKFEHVAEFNNGDISISDNLISVSDIILEESTDILNAVNFSCRLTGVSDAYGISIEEDAVLIVILKDGTVKEYDLWNNSYPYRSRVRICNAPLLRTAKIGRHEFYDIDLSDISYVKLSNLGVWSLKQYSGDDIAAGYEIELYNAT